MKRTLFLLLAALLGTSYSAKAQQSFECNNIYIEYNPMSLSAGGAHSDIKKGVAFRWTEGYTVGISKAYFGGGIMVAYMWDSWGKGDSKVSQSYLTGGGVIDFGYALKMGKNVHLVPAVEILGLINGGWAKSGAETSSQRIHGIRMLELDADLGATLHIGNFAIKGGYTPGITRFSSGVSRNMWHVGVGFDI